jgi:23S rRNA pseudouridine955/2504/2580 synthase/23S rRNA pseudouridine1911/1915/1917 synthase
MSIGQIIFENEKFIAVNKPSGLLTIPDRYEQTLPSLYKLLEKRYQKIFIVHRLDRETSGLILFAKDEATHKHLSGLFEQKDIQKFYLGIVHGSLQKKTNVIDAPIAEHPSKGVMVINKKGKPSTTTYEVVEDYGIYSFVKFRIHTGRTHQKRVHMKCVGHPIVCDELYGNGQPVLLSSFKKKYKLSKFDEEERPILNRLALHSYNLNFIDDSGMQHNLNADLPKDMKALLQQLRKQRIKSNSNV